MTANDLNQLEGSLREKVAHAKRRLAEFDSVAVAYSGGVDSTLLLVLAVEQLGAESVLAVIGVSPIRPARELATARRLADRFGVELLEVPTQELHDPRFTANPPDRCYHCKSGLLNRMRELIEQRGIDAIVSGENVDDTGDYRPGLEAGRQLGAVRPLLDAHLTKADIRAVSRVLGLETWDLPTMSCLATRIPYGQEITAERVGRIEQAEEALADLGYLPCRVRDHGDVARIEVAPDMLDRALADREQILTAVKDAGFTYVALDLQGFRSGAMNEALGETVRQTHTAGW